MFVAFLFVYSKLLFSRNTLVAELGYTKIMANPKQHILILGAGISGLQTSLSLLQCGYRVTIYQAITPRHTPRFSQVVTGALTLAHYLLTQDFVPTMPGHMKFGHKYLLPPMRALIQREEKKWRKRWRSVSD